MHLTVNEVSEAFEPEGGAYSSAVHSHAEAKVAAPTAAKPHVHGPDCNPDHAHADESKPVAIQIHSHKPHSH